MRMWMVNPKLMCRKHLLGEHGEIHKFKHNFEKQHNMMGRVGQIIPQLMQQRHDDLAKEMLNRGYNHNSPYTQPDVSYLGLDEFENSLDIEFNINDLKYRCEDCRRLIENG